MIETQKKKHFFLRKKIFHKSNKAFFYKKNKETTGSKCLIFKKGSTLCGCTKGKRDKSKSLSLFCFYSSFRPHFLECSCSCVYLFTIIVNIKV